MVDRSADIPVGATSPLPEVSLQPPADMPPGKLDPLLQALAVHAVELSERLHRLCDGKGHLADIDAAREICLTLESTADQAQVAGIFHLAGALGAALQPLAERRELPDPYRAKLMRDAADCLEGMYESMQGLRQPPEQAHEILQQLRDPITATTATADSPAIPDAATAVPPILDGPPNERSLERLFELMGRHAALAARLQRLLELHPKATRPPPDELYESLHTLLDRYRQLNRDTEQAVLELSAIPLASLTDTLEQTLHENAAAFGKQAELRIEGGELLIDRVLLQALTEPLQQLIVNALEHGIETETDRLATGKPPTGRITLQARQRSSTLLLSCQDDGQGLQWDAIRVAAELEGLIAPEQPLSERALTRLVLEPGISALPRSEHAARGMGLSAMHARLLQLRGMLNLHSSPGRGCRVELQLPLRRVTAKLLLVRSGETRYAIHEHGLQEVIPPGRGQWLDDGSGPLGYRLHGEHHPAHRLESLLGLPLPQTEPHPDRCPALLLQGDDGRERIVMVDSIDDSLDLAVQKLGSWVPPLPGLVGTVQPDDEQVIPVLDLASLFRQDPTKPLGLPPGRRVLIVDDSPSVVRSLRQLLEAEALAVTSANDGAEALAALERALPDVVLVDLEMPQMDGLTLIQRIRSQSQTRHLPVILITARATPEDIRKAERLGISGYLIKPVADAELLQQLRQTLAV